MLAAGRQLGRYQIRSVLGVGGMGEVYLAHDESLGRTVAIKTLPEDFDADHDRIARFEREARLLASLSHPNIAAVHGFEQADGLRYLVLEHVDGPTLQEKLASGPLELPEALALARQIALALEGAHAAGIIHRDLKPANIKVRPDDTVKVLDFGLAKAFDSAGGSRHAADGLAHSPTITSGGTRDGVLLGTAAYMSPEQARGKAVDKRTDLWAFGCIVYEMLTGRQAFGGETISDSLANVLNRDVDWSRLPAATPPPIRRLLRRCLERDVKARLSDASDARLEIEDALARREEVPHTASAPRPGRLMWATSLMIATASIGAVLWVLLASAKSTPPPLPAPPVRFDIPIAPPNSLSRWYPGFALAPDGQSFVIAVDAVVSGSVVTRLELRRLDQATFEPIKGTEGVFLPFFLPDSETVGFVTFQTHELKLVNLRTGEGRVVCRLESSVLLGPPSATDDLIVFVQRDPGKNSALKMVPVSGGTPKTVWSLDPAQGEVSWPELMPDHDHVLFTVTRVGKPSSIEAISLKTGARRPLLEGALFGQYSSSGHLVFLRSATPGTGLVTGDLVASAFDAATLTASGAEIRLMPLMRANFIGGANGIDVAVAANTLLAIQARQTALGTSSLGWLDRGGQISPVKAAPQPYRQPNLSPTGSLLAFQFDDPDGRDIWVHDLTRDVLSRVTSGPDEDETPKWMPDSRRLVFTGDRGGIRYLLMATTDGSANEERLWQFDDHVHVNGVLADGSAVFVDLRNAATRQDLWVYSFADRKARPFLVTPADEFNAEPSPDGRLVAYVSDESGRREVYVRGTQNGGRTQVSRDGGVEPAWSSDGHELVFRNLDGSRLLRVNVGSAGPRAFSPPDSFLATPSVGLGNRDTAYVVSPDGKQFLLLRNEQASAQHIAVMLNWTGALKQ